MAQGLFELVNRERPGAYPAGFIGNFQTALLLSLLERGLLTQRQFELCAEEVKSVCQRFTDNTNMLD